MLCGRLLQDPEEVVAEGAARVAAPQLALVDQRVQHLRGNSHRLRRKSPLSSKKVLLLIVLVPNRSNNSTNKISLPLMERSNRRRSSLLSKPLPNQRLLLLLKLSNKGSRRQQAPRPRKSLQVRVHLSLQTPRLVLQRPPNQQPQSQRRPPQQLNSQSKPLLKAPPNQEPPVQLSPRLEPRLNPPRRVRPNRLGLEPPNLLLQVVQKRHLKPVKRRRRQMRNRAPPSRASNRGSSSNSNKDSPVTPW